MMKLEENSDSTSSDGQELKESKTAPAVINSLKARRCQLRDPPRRTILRNVHMHTKQTKIVIKIWITQILVSLTTFNKEKMFLSHKARLWIKQGNNSVLAQKKTPPPRKKERKKENKTKVRQTET